ncbi:MAG: hypothetical protein ABIR32_01130 [Ilumatobacteraceae bacterium]
MNRFQAKAAQADELHRNLLTPQLTTNEQLLGAFMATASSAFTNRILVIGVTPLRLMLLEVDRKLQPKAALVSVQPHDIIKSSVDGFGGGLAHFLTSDLGDIRFETSVAKYKLAALGGGLDQLFASDGQQQGKHLFLQFLAAARNIA